MKNMNTIQHLPEDEPFIKMVYDIAHKYVENPRVSFEDYANVGLMALHKARATYKDDMDTKFTTYAYNLIERAVMKEWQENANELSCSAYHVKNTEGAKELVGFQNATVLSLSGHLKSEDGDLSDIIPSGFSASTQSAKRTLASGLQSPEEGAQTAEIIEKVDAILDSLEPQDRDIIYRRMFQGETFETIAQMTGLTWRQAHYKYGKLTESLKDDFVEAGLDIYA